MLKPPINFKNWIESNRNLLKPPVGNQVVYDQGDFMVMVVGGPNSRKDYHVDPVEEFFFQLEGDMLLKVIENGQRADIPIREGEIFLLPKNLHQSIPALNFSQSCSDLRLVSAASCLATWSTHLSIPDFLEVI